MSIKRHKCVWIKVRESSYAHMTNHIRGLAYGELQKAKEGVIAKKIGGRIPKFMKWKKKRKSASRNGKKEKFRDISTI